MNAKLGRGINLGNCLDGTQEGTWGCTIEAAYMGIIKRAGFNHVRLPVRWSNKLDVDNNIDPAFMARVKEVVTQANDSGLLVVMDMHHFDELTGRDNKDYIPMESQIPLFPIMWGQIATQFAGFSNDSLVFELLNEPAERVTAEIHNSLLAAAIPVIRTTNPGRTLVAGLTSLGKWPAVKDLVLPATENNIIVTVHYYDPYTFTHQGYPDTGNPTGVAWGTANEQKGLADYFENMALQINGYFPSLDGKGVPLYIGEFGVLNEADMTSRANWIDAVARNSELNEFSWAYWEFNQGFGAYDPYGKAWYPQMLNALIPPAP
jgi:endoglucanase